jgi:NAD(P)H-dependent flavin oxidoreductase YrpB (nitropropane dioxygenase family)
VDEPLSYPAQMSLTAALRAMGEDARDLHPMWAGQGAMLARAGPAAEIVERTVAEAERLLAHPPA